MDGYNAISPGYSDGDVDTNVTAGVDLNSLIEQRYSRRQTMFGGVGAITAAALSTTLAGCGVDDNNTAAAPVAVTPTVISFGNRGTSSSGKVVALTGTATSGTVSSSRIAQVSGPAVSLTSTRALGATFIAPAVAVATPLVFRLTGTDAAGGAVTSDTTVMVKPARLDFAAIPKNLNDIVTVPAGYTATVLYRLGDPLNAATPAYANNGSDTGFSARAGDHNDALY